MCRARNTTAAENVVIVDSREEFDSMKHNCSNGTVGGLQAQVPVVIRRGSTQILVEDSVPFPQRFPAIEIVQVIKKVRDLNVFVCRNKAVINGVLDVNVIYKTFEGDYNYSRNGNDPRATFGNVRQIGFSIPFSGFVEVPGARPGDDFIVNFAGVEDECELDTLEDPIHLGCSVTAFRRIRLSTIIRVDISVVRNVLIPVGNLGDDVFPVLPAENSNNNNCSCR
jgi:hypothetical protein